MASRERRAIRKSLKEKGFKKHKGGPHEVWRYEPDGIQTHISTIISRGSNYKVYGDKLFGAVATQLKLRADQLEDLVDCPLEAKRYLRILIGKKQFSRDPMKEAELRVLAKE